MRKKFRFIPFIILHIAFYQAIALNNRLTQSSLDSLNQQVWVDSLMRSLTLREKIAQSFMVSAYSNKDQKHIDEIAALIQKEKIGGLIFFQGGPVRQAHLTNYYQSISKIPILISIDGEWGLGMRLDSTFSYPRQMMLGASANPILVYQVASDIAQHMKRIGVHINYAPVIDVNNNPLNPVISSRSFGENRQQVAEMGIEYTKGLQDNGILACAKHFPGHGDTDADSHLALPLVKHPISRLDSIELFPFRKLINSGIASVMVAHLKVPALEKDTSIASSLSSSIIKGYLMDSLGFKGLVFTDALNMKGVAAFHKPVELNYMAYKAGNDILTCPEKITESIDFIESEVAKGNFPIEEVNRKCEKILRSKYQVGLNSYKPIVIDNLVSDLNTPKSELLKRKVIEQGLTLLNGSGLIPLLRLDTLKIAFVEIGKNKGQAFRNQLEMYTSVTPFSIDPESSIFAFDSLLNSLDPYNLIIIGYHAADTRVAKNYGVTLQALNFIFDLSFRKKVILDIFGNPYTMNRILNLTALDDILISFDNSNIAQSLSAQLIFGGIKASGRLPVSATKSTPIGSGVQIDKKIRLKYSIPEELGIDSKYLLSVDSMAYDAIAKQVTPGMQILVAKDGIVFYNKSFGSFTYSNETPVTNKTIYDIASVTKVSATLPSVMRLYDRDSLDLQKTLGDYITLPNGSNKRKLVIKDILLHQSGLQPWIPFYLSTLSSLFPEKPALSSTLSSDYPFAFSDKVFINKYSIPSPKYYNQKKSFSHPFPVAENIFAIEGIKDSIYTRMNNAEVKDAGKLKYSDLGFLYLQRVVENVISNGLDVYVENNFYRHLGMNNTAYQPYKKFDLSRIAPTEDDVTFRKQIIKGYVHDPAAAMMGGIAGHAGVFSTANDLAKLMQMYLQKGEYGGERYFKPGTLDLFTTSPKGKNDNRRALGFDKPEPKVGKPSPTCTSASSSSFGHSGFTGTMVWADPENGLVFIFLSNRVYPDANNNKMVEMNIRTNMQEIFYNALKSIKP